MSDTLIPFKLLLGKYFPELYNLSIQEKYIKTNLEYVFDQRFRIQDNKIQSYIDHTLDDLSVTICGNEVHISKNLYNHPDIIFTNSVENTVGNPLSLYDSDVFSTLSYLMCKNQSTFTITGNIDEPIYVRYKTDYESFYNSIVFFNIESNIKVDIVEEIDSKCALNSVMNYKLDPSSEVNLYSFYKNNRTALSYNFRNVSIGDNGKYNHILLGKGSSSSINENKIMLGNNSEANLSGVVNSNNLNFHSIFNIYSFVDDYTLNIDYKNVISPKSNVTFSHKILGSENSEKNIVSTENILNNNSNEIKSFISSITNKLSVGRTASAKRFYDNKSEFLNFI